MILQSLLFEAKHNVLSAWKGHEIIANYLIRYLNPNIFVELGVHNGFSYFSFCQSVFETKSKTKCFAVDNWLGDKHAGFYEDNVFQQVSSHNNNNYLNFSKLLKMNFDDALNQFKDNSIDLLHIDGLHTYEQVKHDFNSWRPKLSDDAVILFHDVNEFRDDFGVHQLFEELKKIYKYHIIFPFAHGLGLIQSEKAKKEKLVINFLKENEEIIKITQSLYNKNQKNLNLTQVIQAKEKENEQQFKIIEILFKTLTSKDEEITNLTQVTQAKEQEIVNLTQVTQAKEQEIVNLTQVTQANLTQVTQAKEQEIVNLTQVTQAKDQEISEILNSNCWKITFPVRIVGNILKKIKNYILKLIFYFKAYGLKKSTLKVFYFIFRKININKYNNKNFIKNFIESFIKNLLSKKISIPFYSKPFVSIIIPVYGKIDYTLNCLKSISEAKTSLSYEIIIVDDFSQDLTNKKLSKINNIKLFSNKINLGFIKSSNFAAQKAIGEYLVFLNNDTLVTKNWLEELYLTFSNFNEVGLVGSKLIYPNGKLQEAGGIIFKDASGCNYGILEDKDHIDYNYARDVDYCTGASIMISKKLFNDLGGFDEYYSPAYYEDTDLAFKVRKKGLRVIYQPLSEVIHFEGATSGTDINSGAKQYQKINKEKFFTRYQDLLAHHNTSGEHVDKAIDRTRIKNCLVIDSSTPLPDRDSGSIDTYNQLMFLHNYGFHVTFIPLANFANIEHYTQQLQKKGIKCIYHPYYNSLKKFCSDHKNFFDLILINREENFTEIYSLAKKYFPKAKLWLHNVDLNFLRLARQAKIEKNFKLIKRAKEVKNSEIKNNINSDISTVLSIFELNYLTNKRINCELLPLFRIKNQKKIKTFDERNGLVFIAGFNHLPNQDALTYFLDDIFPSLQKHLPGVQCSIIGNNLPKNLLIRIKEFQNIQYYADKSNFELEELVNNHKIGIATLRYGAGIKGKVITYMANHLPFVASNIALEGINLHTIKDCVYHSNTDFVEKIVNLYKDKALYENVQKEISFLYDQNFSEACYKTSFSNILHKLNLSQAESNF